MSPFLFRCKFMLVILLIYSKINKNEQKYPIEKSFGTKKKYTELY